MTSRMQHCLEVPESVNRTVTPTRVGREVTLGSPICVRCRTALHVDDLSDGEGVVEWRAATRTCRPPGFDSYEPHTPVLCCRCVGGRSEPAPGIWWTSPGRYVCEAHKEGESRPTRRFWVVLPDGSRISLAPNENRAYVTERDWPAGTRILGTP